jgi:hypothetical protein
MAPVDRVPAQEFAGQLGDGLHDRAGLRIDLAGIAVDQGRHDSEAVELQIVRLLVRAVLQIDMHVVEGLACER